MRCSPIPKKIEGNEAVGMRCCRLLGKVGGWEGGGWNELLDCMGWWVGKEGRSCCW